MIKKIVTIITLPLCSIFCGALFFSHTLSRDFEVLLKPERYSSLIITDRNGKVLRETPSSYVKTRGKWVKINEISRNFIDALIAVEDHRFFKHPGVDPFSMARAFLDNVSSMKIVSGGSTITMQVVKMAKGWEGRKGIDKKIFEMIEAIFLERKLDKNQILEIYANIAGFGNLTRGVGSASWLYFRKPPMHLTLSEASSLVAMLKAPTALSPYKHPERLEKRRKWVLKRMLELGKIDRQRFEYAVNNPPVYMPPSHPFLAPHLVDEIIERAGREKFNTGKIVTTIDSSLQEEIQGILKNSANELKRLDITNAACVVMDNKTGEVLSYVGSTSYFDEENEGMNDGVMAKRSPGSALKPFIYAEGFANGLRPSDIIIDEETFFETPSGIYRPMNYDGRFHGPVTARVALASSYNIPAMKVAWFLSVNHVLETLRKAGFESLKKNPEHYGVAIAIGDGEVSLFELVSAYSAIARGGVWREPIMVKKAVDGSGKEIHFYRKKDRIVMTPQISFMLADILSDPVARTPGFGMRTVFDFPYPVAVKTGTSNDYRDNFAIGFSSEVTVGVWVGNFSGKPMGNVSGITGAGPIFRKVMNAAMRGRRGSEFKPPHGIVQKRVCAITGKLAGKKCSHSYLENFIEGNEPHEYCNCPAEYEEAFLHGQDITDRKIDEVLEIITPSDGSQFIINPDIDVKLQKIKVRVGARKDDMVKLYMDGEIVGETGFPFLFYIPAREGKHFIEAEGRWGRSSKVEMDIQ